MVQYEAVIKKQGGGSRIYPNAFTSHIGKRAKIIILKEDSEDDPPRLALQLQNQITSEKSERGM
ncbi:hypothetical protein [Methanococcus maripaludis]|uniref:Putative transposon-encoded protein n=1 Tax=Methanococcus maripaludis TaxID=39152 RepID=A0A7J9PNX4_METMI|nr:hypothetical protein [Methanococcus maripaludis]MBA2864410.1 putative transposon-encoded protein [Methanococcus maripaludis]